MRASCFRLLALWTALLPPAAAAQWPGEVDGRVVDALSGRGVEAASVGLAGTALHVLTDASGRFRLRSVSPGLHELTVERVGYQPARTSVRVENGRTARVEVELSPRALGVEGITARVSAGEASARRVVPGSSATAGARTVADLVEGLPGVTVNGRGPGSARTVSIRGSAADAVLVLVDGVPLNDPLTGEADLSLVPVDAVEEVVVLPGARSARYGARAQAGVLLVRTGGTAAGARARAAVGSLGRAAGELAWSPGDEVLGGFVSASAETVDGRFDFEQDPAVGGGSGRRINADVERWGVRAGADARVLSGSVRLRLGLERLERGLPGRSFAPSPRARQEERRIWLSAGWSGAAASVPAELDVHAVGQRTRFRDPAPAAGLPYDQTNRVVEVGMRGLLRHPSPPGPLEGLALGWEVDRQHVEADALEAGAAEAGPSDRADPVRRTDAGGFVTADLPLGGGLSLRGAARLDRTGDTGAWVGTHELGLAGAAGPATLRLAHRSSYSPPALADRFFRAGVGVEPNPDLAAERVPSELEAGLAAVLPLGAWSVEASLELYRADVRGMIVWSPDYRFVWSPRNVDVRRRGLEAGLEGATSLAGGRLRLTSSWSVAKATYARSDLRHLQLRYRPRHSGGLAATWESSRHGMSVEARYVGSRLPVPADVNRLPGFWTVDVAATTAVVVGGWRLEPSLRVDRLRDARDAMIFAFPEPGRTLAFELAVRRADASSR